MRRQISLVLLLSVFWPVLMQAAISPVSGSATVCIAKASLGTTCTLTAATTSGNDVVIGLSWKNTTVSISEVVGSAPNSFFVIYAQEHKTTSSASAILVCVNCASLTTITPTFSGSTDYVLTTSEWSGVAWMGTTAINAPAKSTTPGLTMTTGDENDYIVVDTSSLGSAGLPTAGTGTLVEAGRTGALAKNVAGGLIYNTVAKTEILALKELLRHFRFSVTNGDLPHSDIGHRSPRL